MKIKVITKKPDEIEVEIDDLTIAELLRNYLWEDKRVQKAAWKKEHPTKNPILMVKTKSKSAKKVLLDCISKVEKLNENFLKEFKKAVK